MMPVLCFSTIRKLGKNNETPMANISSQVSDGNCDDEFLFAVSKKNKNCLHLFGYLTE
jgi:hypothetical protein